MGGGRVSARSAVHRAALALRLFEMLSAIAVAALLAVSPLAAQQPPPATSAEDVERKFTVLEKAIADAQRLGLERQLADALCALGEAFQEQALYTAARE